MDVQTGKHRKAHSIATNRMGYLLILPLFIFIITFLFFPVGYSFYISLFHYDPFDHSVYFTGIANYITAMRSPLYWIAMGNVAKYTAIVVTVQTFFAFSLALLFNKRHRITRLVRGIVIIPAVFSSVATAIIFEWVFSVSGPVNFLRMWLGMSRINYFLNLHWAFPAIMTLNIFTTSPYFMIFYLAGLQSIPSSIYDAAAIDGVTSPLSRFRYIYWPMLSFTTIIVVILGIIGSFQLFDQIYIITSGGPNNTTLTPLFLVYSLALVDVGSGLMGLAAAESVVLFLVILVITLLQSRYLRQARWS